MRLVGLQILKGTDKAVRKVLKQGWYPFIKCEKDIGETDEWPKIDEDVLPKDFYKINGSPLDIHISAIVGKNGTGKSTLIGLLFRIINNFVCAIKKQNHQKVKMDVIDAMGLQARLFFEIDQKIWCIYCNQSNLELYCSQELISPSNYLSILPQLFYTISVNYSHYFNVGDESLYYSPQDKQIINISSVDWIEKLYHKSDGYFVPIVLIPYRDKGQIMAEREDELALDRIIVFSLLYHAHRESEFLESYSPDYITYTIDEESVDRKVESFRRSLKQTPVLRKNLDLLLRRFEALWEKYLTSIYPSLDVENKVCRTAIYYLAYKSLKVNYKHGIGKNLFDVWKCFPEKDSSNLDMMSLNFNNQTQAIELYINYLVQLKNDAMTEKIRQCLQFIKKGDFRESFSERVDDLNLNRASTYEQVVDALKPNFYKKNLFYQKITQNQVLQNNQENKLSIRTLSSGEKQYLYSLSYILYHIYNISRVDSNTRIAYHHVNIVMDEVELYYHPEFQRQFISKLIAGLKACGNGENNLYNVQSINILMATHSPFILSDIPDTNVLFLGNNDNITKMKTLGANVYELLQNSFFMSSSIGEIAKRKINWIINLCNCKDEGGETIDKNERNNIFRDKVKKEEIQYIINHIGDEYLSNVLSIMERNISRETETTLISKQERKERLRKEIERLQKEYEDEYK